MNWSYAAQRKVAVELRVADTADHVGLVPAAAELLEHEGRDAVVAALAHVELRGDDGDPVVVGDRDIGGEGIDRAASAGDAAVPSWASAPAGRKPTAKPPAIAVAPIRKARREVRTGRNARLIITWRSMAQASSCRAASWIAPRMRW